MKYLLLKSVFALLRRYCKWRQKMDAPGEIYIVIEETERERESERDRETETKTETERETERERETDKNR